MTESRSRNSVFRRCAEKRKQDSGIFLRAMSCLCLPSCCRNAGTSGVQRGFYTDQRAQAPALTFARQMNFPAEPPPTAMLHNFCDRQVLQPQIDQQCCATGFPFATEGDNKRANAVAPLSTSISFPFSSSLAAVEFEADLGCNPEGFLLPTQAKVASFQLIPRSQSEAQFVLLA